MATLATITLESGSWNKPILQELFSLRQQNLLCDVHLMGSDKRSIPVHSCVLAAASSNLRSLIVCNLPKLRGSDEFTIHVPSVSTDILEIIISFIYLGTFSCNLVDFFALSNVAEQLEIKELLKVCKMMQRQCRQIAGRTQAAENDLIKKEESLKERINQLHKQLEAHEQTKGRRPEAISEKSALYQNVSSVPENQSQVLIQHAMLLDTVDSAEPTHHNQPQTEDTLQPYEESLQSNSTSKDAVHYGKVHQTRTQPCQTQYEVNSIQNQTNGIKGITNFPIKQLSKAVNFESNVVYGVNTEVTPTLVQYDIQSTKDDSSPLESSRFIHLSSCKGEGCGTSTDDLSCSYVYVTEGVDTDWQHTEPNQIRYLFADSHQVTMEMVASEVSEGFADDMANHELGQAPIHSTLANHELGQTLQSFQNEKISYNSANRDLDQKSYDHTVANSSEALDVDNSNICVQPDHLGFVHYGFQTTDSSQVLLEEHPQRLLSETAVPGPVVSPTPSQGRPFKCKDCCKTFRRAVLLQSHMIVHTDRRPYTCQLCTRAFKHKQNLQNHMSRHGVKEYVCNACSKAFYTKNELVLHHRTHTGDKPFPCQWCDKSFSQKSNLISHQRCCHSEQSSSATLFECPKCGKRFKAKTLLCAHQRSHTRLYTCSQCTQSFDKRFNFKRHLKEVHELNDALAVEEEGMDHFECFLCSKKFVTLYRLQSHQAMVHMKCRRFECDHPDCHYFAYYQSKLDRHKKKHDKPVNISRKKSRRTKSKTGEVTLFVCTECGKTFNNKKLFTTHNAIHMKSSGLPVEPVSPSPSKPVLLSCPLCTTMLSTVKGLELHMETHSEHRTTYSCTTCGKQFFHQFHLNRHMAELHSKSKRYQCSEDHCGYRTFYYYDMVKHYKRKHGGVKVPDKAMINIGDKDTR